ncbi:MAG: TetR/AcrR family transcriptional regulator [Bacilli bacterium]|nr:TetR/AcrR family transcriptional regulator [Bacilli bacterium]
MDERIIRTVIQLGMTDGVQKISTKKVASILRITEPTIYVHFKTKENLLKTAYEKAYNNVYGNISSILDDESLTFEEKLLKIIEQAIEGAAKQPESAVFYFRYEHLLDLNLSHKLHGENSNHILKGISDIWHKEKGSNSMPHADASLLYLVYECISCFIFRAASGQTPATPASAKLLFSVLLEGLYHGNLRFEKELTPLEEQEFIKQCEKFKK